MDMPPITATMPAVVQAHCEHFDRQARICHTCGDQALIRDDAQTAMDYWAIGDIFLERAAAITAEWTA